MSGAIARIGIRFCLAMVNIKQLAVLERDRSAGTPKQFSNLHGQFRSCTCRIYRPRADGKCEFQRREAPLKLAY
jgi:hypothetical protein